MNRKIIYIVVSTLVLTILIAVVLRTRTIQERKAAATAQNEMRLSDPGTALGGSPAPPRLEGSQNIDEAHKEDVRQGLEIIHEGLKRMGAKEVPLIAATLRDAAASRDAGVLRRAFHEATYGRFAQMSDAIPAMRDYLDFPEPYVRYLAAEALLRVGDQSGMNILVELAGSREPILQKGSDLRIEAARLLGRYGDRRASSALEILYAATGDGSVLNAMARVQGSDPSEKLVADIIERRSPGFVAFNLGLIGTRQGEAIVFKAFDDPKVPEIYAHETKVIAAWALARITGNEDFVKYLSEVARPSIESNNKGGYDYDMGTKALRYLGSIRSPQAVQVLESALESPNPVAVQYATVNLLFNHLGGSEKAEKLVLRELQSSPSVLGTELIMKVASKLDNPQIRAAAESFAARTGSDSWRYWGVERSNWPVQNWIYDYVVTLNP